MARSLRELAHQNADPRLVAASVLEAQADMLHVRSDDLLNDAARFRQRALDLRRAVEDEADVARFGREADAELAVRRGRVG